MNSYLNNYIDDDSSYNVLKQSLFNFAKDKGPRIPPSIIDTTQLTSSKLMLNEAVDAYSKATTRP